MTVNNNKLYVSIVSLIVTLLFGMAGLVWSFAQDRQDIAVAIESLAAASAHQSEVSRGLQRSITEIEQSLRLLAQQNASVLVLQSQLAEMQRRIDKLEKSQ